MSWAQTFRPTFLWTRATLASTEGVTQDRGGPDDLCLVGSRAGHARSSPRRVSGKHTWACVASAKTWRYIPQLLQGPRRPEWFCRRRRERENEHARLKRMYVFPRRCRPRLGRHPPAGPLSVSAPYARGRVGQPRSRTTTHEQQREGSRRECRAAWYSAPGRSSRRGPLRTGGRALLGAVHRPHLVRLAVGGVALQTLGGRL